MLPTYLLLSESCNVVHNLLNFLISQVKLHKFRNLFEVFEGQCLFFLEVNQVEHGPSALSAEGIAEFVGEFFEEELKIDPLSIELLGDLLEAFVNEFVFFVEAESFCGIEDVGDVALPSVVAVKIEHIEEVFAVFSGKDGVFGDDFFGEDSPSFLFGELLSIDDHGYCRLRSIRGKLLKLFQN